MQDPTIQNNINNTDTELKHRRKGGAFDMFARILRGVNKIIFNTGTVMNDRPGLKQPGGSTSGFTDSQSVFELYQEIVPKKNNFNFIVIGKKANQEKTNTNYIEISANSRSDEANIANGQVMLSLARDGVLYDAGISILEASNYPDLFPGSGARIQLVGEGIGGGISIAYPKDDGTYYMVVVDNDGIQMYGLPTVKPTGSNQLWKSGEYVKIT